MLTCYALVEHQAIYNALFTPYTGGAGPDSWRVDPSYLTSEQAMADYATLLWDLTHSWQATDR